MFQLRTMEQRDAEVDGHPLRLSELTIAMPREKVREILELAIEALDQQIKEAA